MPSPIHIVFSISSILCLFLTCLLTLSLYLVIPLPFHTLSSDYQVISVSPSLLSLFRCTFFSLLQQSLLRLFTSALSNSSISYHLQFCLFFHLSNSFSISSLKHVSLFQACLFASLCPFHSHFCFKSLHEEAPLQNRPFFVSLLTYIHKYLPISSPS